MARYGIDPLVLLGIAAGTVAWNPEHQLVAPNALRSQALQRLYDAVRRGDLTEKEALARHTRLTEVKIRLLGDRVSRRTAWDIATEQGWEDLGEAEYIAVTRLQADALMALEPRLVARADGLVPMAPVEALAG